MSLLPVLTWLPSVWMAAADGDGAPASPGVDPLLLAEAAQVWAVATDPERALWPGWDPRATPILFYLPGVQDVLVNHPHPPEGFGAADWLPAVDGFEVRVRNGRTQIQLDGQNTATEVAGVTTLVVADTLSNRRQQWISQVEAAVAADPLDGATRDASYSALATDPYQQMALIAHEAFHVYQHHHAPAKGANELAVLTYPTLSVDNNVGMALEGETLARALEVEFEDELEEQALRWLAIRHARRATLPAAAIDYEDGNEWNEGLARYIEYRLFQELEGADVVPGLMWAQGFHGLADLSAPRRRLLARLRDSMSGRLNVNNDRYGMAPARMRLYDSGMAIGVLLDRLGVDWHERILEPGTTLTGLVEERLEPGDEELRDRWEEIAAEPGTAVLRTQKQKLQEDGRRDNERLVQSILDGPATCLVLDHSALQVPGIAMPFTPFGVRVIDDERVVYTMIPMGARITEGNEMQQTVASPMLQEKRAGRLLFQLQRRIGPDDLVAALGQEPGPGVVVEHLDLELPGATLTLRRATIEWQGGALVFRLQP